MDIEERYVEWSGRRLSITISGGVAAFALHGTTSESLRLWCSATSVAGNGLLVTDMFGPSLNPNTGDYSVGVSGFWFENGEKAYPVSEVTVAGDLPSMLLRAIPGSDLEIRGSTNAPSLLIDGMALAGR